MSYTITITLNIPRTTMLSVERKIKADDILLLIHKLVAPPEVYSAKEKWYRILDRMAG